MTPEERERGRVLRLEVLGREHVETTAGGGDPLMRGKTALSEYVWAKVWARPGIPRKYRSVANLAMLTALNRMHELRLHVGSALNNGLTPDEICEVLLQAASYCGIAAGREAFAVAVAVFRERGIEVDPPSDGAGGSESPAPA